MKRSWQSRLAEEAGHNEIAATLLGYRRLFVTVLIFTVIMNLLMLASPLYMMQVYDRVLASGNVATLVMLTILLVGAFLMQSGLERIRSMLLIKMSKNLDERMNTRVFQAAFSQNLKDTGVNAGQALQDLSSVRQFATGNGILAFFDAPWFPIYLFVIFLFSPWLGWYAVFSAGMSILLAWMNEVGTHKPLEEASKVAVQSSNMATNTLRNAEVIHAMGMLPALRKRWYDFHKQYLDLQTSASVKSSGFTTAIGWVNQVMGASMIGFAGFLALEGLASPGVMIAATILLGKCTAPVQRLIGVWKNWRSVVSAYKRLGLMLAKNPEPLQGMPLPVPKGVLKVEKVTTAPPGVQTALLKGIDFSIGPGDALAVMGPSGSGKSTLAKVLVGIWPSTLGSVRLDGVDIFSWNRDELGPNIGYLPQDIQLFAGSVSDNIARFGDVDSEKVVEAATLVGIHELILKLPKGYDTVLGDGGSGLSGGQKQRVGIARAFYGAPAFILLDEPNANLDEEGERALAVAIAKLRQMGKTLVVMTHRLNIVQATNKMLVIRDGQIHAMGPTMKVLEALMKPRTAAAEGAAADAAKNQSNTPNEQINGAVTQAALTDANATNLTDTA